MTVPDPLQHPSEFSASEHPHRRRNLLTGEWVLVSPHRTKRPWQGQVERSTLDVRPRYDPNCYLCPGNERAGGKRNPKYKSTFVFENDFAALVPYVPDSVQQRGELFELEPEAGICRVICFNPRHDLTLPEMEAPDIRKVVDVWVQQVEELGSLPNIEYVQLFENKGQMMGSSNPHPHGQVWANQRVPNVPATEDAMQRAYFARHGSPLLVDYLEAERQAGERIVVENRHWTALVPFWAVWPFETLLLPNRHVVQLSELDEDERTSLADALKRLLIRYDNLFETSFPYSMGWHGQPTNGNWHEHWQLHAHFLPPLLRSATVKKFMVGYEMLASPQRDITAEQAAERIRAVSDVHYKREAGTDQMQHDK